MEFPLLTLFSLLVFLLVLLVFFRLISISFVKLGVPRSLVGVLLVAILVGSFVNIPLFALSDETPERLFRSGRMFFRVPPQVTTTVVAVNVGGAVIPFVLSILLLTRAPLVRTAIGVVVVGAVAFAFARAIPGEGIVLNAFIPPVVAAVTAMVLAWRRAAPMAYISGVVGTIIGADLLHMSELLDGRGTYLSIGGAGVFDGIFLVGIVAAFLSPASRDEKQVVR